MWDKHYGERCIGVRWDLFVTKDDMLVSNSGCIYSIHIKSKIQQGLLSAMGSNLLSNICSEFAKDNHLGRAGLPDLTLWKPADRTCKVFQ